jgi:hypothetical protein
MRDWQGGHVAPVNAHFLCRGQGRKRYARRCEEERKLKRKIYMRFMRKDGCYCQVLEEDLKMPLPLQFVLDDPEKIKEMARKGGASRSYRAC